LKKDINPLKILAQISAVELKFKQSLSKEKKVEVVQGCTGDNYAQIIVVTDKVAQIELQQNATALKLCEAMKQSGASKVTTMTMKKTMTSTMTAWGWKPH
jgi:hypothetical protein